jgi:hypothetical protein
VKKTLSNFRYGERYSKWNLYSIDSFLSSLLDRGYAGRATPIGTDYRNLELAGVVKVEKIAGDINGKYRFWLLKRDVIEDVQNIIKGNIPFTTNIPEINLSSMDNTVTSRMSIAASPHLNVEEVTDAIRQIQGAIFS